ncbi:hypothetical protein ALQ38_05578 [Pseudomonas marginalis pv. marginalis]|nr:hypothetical protein ALQ38_05578 [Pseudomonas marginalis pv. marginalis]
MAPLGGDAGHFYLPDFKRGAWAKAQACVGIFQVQRLCRVTAPVDVLFHFRAKPQHAVIHGLGQAHGQYTTGHLLELHRRRVDRRQVMAGKHRLAALLQPPVQRADLRRFRAVAVAVQLLVFDDRHATGQRQVHQQLTLLCQAVEYIHFRGLHRPIQQGQSLDFFLALAAQVQGFHRADLQRQYLADGLAGSAQVVRHQQWLAVAAADQAPESVALHQRDTHGRQHAHVLHVLAVNRRHTAQGGKTQVQRLAGVRAQLGQQGDRLVGRIRDDAQPVGAIQLAGLLRNVGRREEESVEQLHGRRGRLCDHLAVAFFFEAIDQHTVVAGHGLDFIHADFVQRLQGFCRLQALQHLAQVAGAPVERPWAEILEQGFELEHQHVLMAVQQAFELRAVKTDVQRRGVEKRVVFGHGGDGLGVLDAHQGVQRLVQQRFGRLPEQGADVGADLNDLQVRLRQRQQHAVGLDRPRKADGLVGTVGKQLFKIVGFHSSTSWLSSHCSKQLNVERAASTACCLARASSGRRPR